MAAAAARRRAYRMRSCTMTRSSGLLDSTMRLPTRLVDWTGVAIVQRASPSTAGSSGCPRSSARSRSGRCTCGNPVPGQGRWVSRSWPRQRWHTSGCAAGAAHPFTLIQDALRRPGGVRGAVRRVSSALRLGSCCLATGALPALPDLDSMGINNYHLFPDFTGLSSRLTLIALIVLLTWELASGLTQYVPAPISQLTSSQADLLRARPTLTPLTAGAFTGSYRELPWRKANAQRRPLPSLLWRLPWRLLAAGRHGRDGCVHTQPGTQAALAGAGAAHGEPTMVAAPVVGPEWLAAGGAAADAETPAWCEETPFNLRAWAFWGCRSPAPRGSEAGFPAGTGC